ncbi:PREDICTED: uncharacterized protein LOC109229770 [Nicotiana attenuata]|uniref:uncharacterized protein LOC109229770 n=1 Tax=Nicotiana attenuata TaxID=49451 RepID=UPI000904EF97|nr:PREDICTED: uncharacterized protein LOC109229770 [Nicotiana attenuata]
MIIGGGGDTSINNVKFTTTHKFKRSITHEQYDELEENTDVRRIMVDDRSGACIIHPRVLAQMKLEDKIVPRCITITGFNNAVERTSREITLPVLASGVTLETTFHIMDQDTAYNAIIGRPWIHVMRAIPPACTKSSNFQLHVGIFSIRVKQCTSRQCYRITLDCTITQQMKGKAKEA